MLRPIGEQDAVWRFEEREIVPVNRREPPSRLWSVPAPAKEGTYVLELQAVWEAVGARDGSRIGRLIRRRKGAHCGDGRAGCVVLTVVDPAIKAGAVLSNEGQILARSRSIPWTWPGSAIEVLGLGAVARVGGGLVLGNPRRDPRRGGPPREGAPNGCGASSPAPGRAREPGPGRPDGPLLVGRGAPRRASRQTPSDHRFDRRRRPVGGRGLRWSIRGSRGEARLLLDACGSGPPVLNSGPATTFNWTFWPGATEPVLILLNRSSSSDVRVGTVKLAELDPTSAPRPSQSRPTAPARGVGVLLTGPNAVDRFGGRASRG